MKQTLAIILLLLSSFSFSQDKEKENELYKPGVIKVRKVKAEFVIVSDFEEKNILLPVLSSNSAQIVYESPCKDLPWMRSKWKMEGFPNKAFNREYIIDAMEVENCENVTLIYYKDEDTVEVKGKMYFVDSNNQKRVTFSYFENGEEKEFFFDYELNIQTKQKDFQSDPDNPIIDTVSIAILLNSVDKGIRYSLVYGNSANNHNYFPGVCKLAHDTVQKWISNQKDEDGFRHKLIFKSCSEIEIQYQNPAKKNRIEALKIKVINGKNYIELKRQRINVPDKYFNSQYTIEFKEDKLILQNEKERFSYSIYNL